jgi:hypothetical protein
VAIIIIDLAFDRPKPVLSAFGSKKKQNETNKNALSGMRRCYVLFSFFSFRLSDTDLHRFNPSSLIPSSGIYELPTDGLHCKVMTPSHVQTSLIQQSLSVPLTYSGLRD